LFNVTGGPSLSLYDVNQAAAIIRETAHPDANMIFGAVIDETMGDEMRVTVIATGFERTLSRRQMLQQQYGRPSAAPISQPRPEPQPQPVSVPAALPAREPEPEPVQPRFAPNNLEIPAFLRRR
ncbi:MAG TPA: cell division protein FtsZ, partial [Chloroflexota bacterium]|nr:cell division protein FtsZ [Chloroflexota bacterium]